MATFTIPLEVLTGIYLGILTGVLPALLAFGFGFVFRYVTGVTIPAFAVVVLALALAGVNGGLLAFVDPTITQSANSVALMVAVVVVLMLSLYTHALGDRLASTVPRRVTFEALRSATVSADVVEFVGGRGEVSVSVVGEVRDMEGYPPLSDDLRADLGAVEWRFPADLPLEELASRMAERYRSAFDLEEVDVDIDQRGRAIVTAAPPSSGVSRRLEPGLRAVSIDALVPTGVARGDAVTVLTETDAVTGTVVSASSGTATTKTETAPPHPEPDETDDAPPVGSEPQRRAPTTAGGEGRVTVAVSASDAKTLLAATAGRIVITARGSHREYELVSVLRQAGQRLRRLGIGTDGPLDGTRLDEAGVREEFGVAILAVHEGDGWTVGPRGDTLLRGGTDVFAVGTRDGLDRFAEAVA